MTDDELLERRAILIRGVIEDESAQDIIAKMLYLQHLDAVAAITLHIDSPGGSLTSGLAIYDAIEIVGTAVHVRCHEAALGIAALIAAHGTKGERIAARSTNLSITEPYSSGNSHVAEQELARATAIMIEMLSKDTGLLQSQVAELMRSGRRIGAIEAWKLGFIDSIDDTHLDLLRQ